MFPPFKASCTLLSRLPMLCCRLVVVVPEEAAFIALSLGLPWSVWLLLFWLLMAGLEPCGAVPPDVDAM